MTRLPVLFLGHGSPMNTLFSNNTYNQAFAKIAQTFPKPKSILVISAHWCSRRTEIMTWKEAPLVYDFYGFPRELYQLKYPSPGSPELAKRVSEILSEYHVKPEERRGLDHGAWCVLRHLYPQADVPAIQLSIDVTLSPEQHWKIAEKLRVLRDEGVLILCSGDIVHNLGEMDFDRAEQLYQYKWADDFRKKINEAILSKDKDTLVNFENLPFARKAVPTPSDHYLPIIYAMAQATEKDRIDIFNDDIVGGSLSMTSVCIHE
ncbi:Catalytic LigB subunit of aromatic ring-opening dioxygenase family protein [Trichomonas vaginalis G3]|uniref:Catalytic LigB subunit of aromatic ring-opening dioxygenase family protein n=1 Tax=Trichomonas vaginalis (strain ATCC PRA-98 / G3) TaxID=412133 RepID=A2DM70_TRIV3|nr:ferrous iron binding [Trichomonas vaginalis G3]EAY18490.1 Catalytic LigB subunit of aromatic ring-opening dioxygenase family protein [Trichomonas vaginalis G3]KAI5489521.1 ferrous iron binding [Trichomonas vaginalis G3]|eukprot:XP_001579476.1 Catalytic LigB subunit of aromatic ring-opening dioxygenase family protein [Trichomonas vaginalis G3]